MVRNILYIMRSEFALGGAEHSLLLLIKGLNKERFHPVVVYPYTNKLLEASFKESNITKIPFNFASIKELKMKPFISLKILWELKRIVNKYKIDIIHTNRVNAQIYGGIIGFLTRKPSICHVRDIMYNWSNDWIGAVTKFITFHFTKKIIAISDAVASVFKDWSKVNEKVVTIYNPVDIDKFNSSIDGEKIHKEYNISSFIPIISYIGPLTQWKGVHYLIESLVVVKKEIPEIKLLIVGDAYASGDSQKYKQELYQLVVNKKLKNNVIFTGYREDISEVIGAMDVVIQPSVMPEPFGRSIIEAMACAKPVIGTNIGGIPEIIENNVSGLLIPPHSQERIAEAILYLLSNREKSLIIGKEGRKQVELKFSLKEHVNKVEKIYASLLTRRK